MKFWKICGPEYNEHIIYITTTQDCTCNELIEDLDKIFQTADHATYYIEEITRSEYDKATVIW